MRRPTVAASVVVALAACGSDHARLVASAPVAPTVAVPPSSAAPEPIYLDSGLEPEPSAFPEAPLEERIAAIERGMNDLAPVSQQCWAAAAADDFRVAGEVRLLVAVAGAAGEKTAATIVADTTGDAVLARCLTSVAAEYAWAPPLRGQQVELPFHFAAPAMQNVIDRRFVPYRSQSGIELGVLLDETNTGNPKLSLLELRFAAGASSGPRRVERTEVWIFLSAAEVRATGLPSLTLTPGDMMLVPVGAAIAVTAEGHPAHALVGVVPGGREGVARAGALPGPHYSAAVNGPPAIPALIRATEPKRYSRRGGATTIMIEPPLAKKNVSVSMLEIDAGVTVQPHVHAKETEVLYILAGGGTMTIGNSALPVTAHSVVQIPAGVKHGFVATSATKAVQFYAPAGPEQRFKTMK